MWLGFFFDTFSLTHGFQSKTRKVSATSLFWESVPYRVSPDTGLIDFEHMETIAKSFRPKILIAGGRFRFFLFLNSVLTQENGIMLDSEKSLTLAVHYLWLTWLISQVLWREELHCEFSLISRVPSHHLITLIS